MSKYKTNSAPALSEMFSALSNPNRLELFTRLASCCQPGSMCCAEDSEMVNCVGDLGQDLDIAPSTLSHHLKELNRAGLIQMQRKGKNVECWIEPKTIRDLSSFFMQFIKESK